MVLQLPWILRKRLLWICALLSSTSYPAFCQQDQDDSTTAGLSRFLQENPNEEGAPTSGPNFYSSKYNRQKWWDDDDLGHDDEDKMYYFPIVQTKKLNTAVNLKLGDGANFSNTGDLGSNIIYSTEDSTANTGSFYTSKRYTNTRFPQVKPWRMNSAVNIDLGSSSRAENRGQIGTNILLSRDSNKEKTYGEFLKETRPQMETKRLQTAVNLKLDKYSTFDNQGSIGSNLRLYKEGRTKNRRSNGRETYLRQNYYPQIRPWNLGTAVNLKLGPASAFGNNGNIGSNIVSNRKFNFFTEPDYYGHGMPVRDLQSEKLFSNYGIRSNNQGYKDTSLAQKERDGFMINEEDPTFSKRPHFQRRTMNSAANLNFGPQSMFDNIGKVGSNIIFNNNAMLNQQNRVKHEPQLRYPPPFPRQKMNAAVNLNTKYGTYFENEGEIGSNILYNASRRTMNDIAPGTYYPQFHRSTINSGANLNVGSSSIFANRGKIGSNIMHHIIPLKHPSDLRTERMNAAANLITGYGAKFDNEGAIGSNLFYSPLRRPINSGAAVGRYPQLYRRTMNSAANLNLGTSSTFGNEGKIGSNIISNKSNFKLQRHYSPPINLSYPSHIWSEQLNAAVNLNTGYGTKFDNEGEIGSNLFYSPRTIKNRDGVHSEAFVPQFHRRTINSAANLNLGSTATFGNRGQIGSNILRNRYNPEISLRYPSHLQSENLHAAANLQAGFGAKFDNEGEIGSNLLYSATRRTKNNLAGVSTYFPQFRRRTMNSAANLNLGPSSMFDNKGTIGSNIIPNYAMLRTQERYSHVIPLRRVGKTMNSGANLNLGSMTTFGNRGQIGSTIMHNRKLASFETHHSYNPEIPLSYPSQLRSEKLNAAVNLNTGYGAKFDNEGEIGSNVLYSASRKTMYNGIQSENYLPQLQRRTMNSGTNLNLGSYTRYSNRGQIGSNQIDNRRLALLKMENNSRSVIALKQTPDLRSNNMNAAANLYAGYGAKFGNEGEIGSNILYNPLRKTTYNLDRIFPIRTQYLRRRTMNSAANLNFGPQTTFGNRGKIGTNLIGNRGLEILRPLNSNNHGIPFYYSQQLRNDNAAVNLISGYDSEINNENAIESNSQSNRTSRISRMYPRTNFPRYHKKKINLGSNFKVSARSLFGNGDNIGPNLLRNSNEENDHIYGVNLRHSHYLRPKSMNSAANLKLGYGANFGNAGSIGSTLIRDREGGIFIRQRGDPENFKSAANLNFEPGSYFSNSGLIGSSVVNERDGGFNNDRHYGRIPRQFYTYMHRKQSSCPINHKIRYIPDLQGYFSPTNSAHNLFDNPKTNTRFGGTSLVRKNLDPSSVRHIQNELKHFLSKTANPNYVCWDDNAANNRLGSFGETELNRCHKYEPDYEAKGNIKILTHRSAFLGSNSNRLNSAVNMQIGPGSSIINRGEIGANVVTHLSNGRQPSRTPGKMQTAVNIDLGSGSMMSNLGSLGSNSIFNRRSTSPRALRFPDFQNDRSMLSFVDVNGNNVPRFQYPTVASDYKLNRFSGDPVRNAQSAANLNLDSSVNMINTGTIDSTFITDPYAIQRNIGQRFASNPTFNPSSGRISNRTPFRTPYIHDYDVRALRTLEMNTRNAKGMVNINRGSDSLFKNRVSLDNKYRLISPSSRRSLPRVTSYAYVKPPSKSKGRSALSDAEVITGISTRAFRRLPMFPTYRVGNNYNRNLKHVLSKRSSLINDGAIGAAEMLFSRGSVVASNPSKTEMSNSAPATVSFGKLGLDMTKSSNQASIVAGDNAHIVVNGKMGTYQVSIPIGSIVASEGSGINMRTAGPFWSDLFSATSALGLKSSLKFLKNLNSVITGVVKVMSTDIYGHNKVDFCELENPITAVEIGRPLLSNRLFLQLLLITKLRTNLANLLAYLTAINAAKVDKRVHASLQLLYNAIQYRQVNVLPLLLLKDNWNTIPRKYHFKVMLGLLLNVAPSNVRDVIKILINGMMQPAVEDISENLIPLLTDTLDMEMIPDILKQLQRNVVYGDMDVFVNQIVQKAFFRIPHIRSIRELKDIIYLTMLNLPMSYSFPQLPIKLRLVAQMLLMELPDEVWACAAIAAQHMSVTNVYTGLKNFMQLLLECPKVPVNIHGVVWDTIRVIPDSLPSNDIHELSLTSSAPTAVKVIFGNSVIDNRAYDTAVEVTNSLGNVIVKRG